MAKAKVSKRQMILDYLTKRKTPVTVAELATRVNTTEKTVHVYLCGLRKDHDIQTTRKGRHAAYSIS